MTRDEFKAKSNELFFEIKNSLYQKIIESAEPIFEKAADEPDKISALNSAYTELSQLTSNLAFQASCDYSEKLSLMLFDEFSN